MKVFLTLLGALFGASAVVAFPAPSAQVPPQCVDPTFACQDLESARLCGVVKSCIDDIWSTMRAPDDNDEICDLCKEMVKEARDQLLSNMTQEEIKEVFEGSCKLLPIKFVADGCIKIFDEIIPQLVEMLASRMDPNMVCTVSGLCNAAHLPLEKKMLKVLKEALTHHSSDQCSECTTMMTDVKNFVKSMPEPDMKVYAEKVCHEKLPSYLCDILVDKYFSDIYDYVSKSDAKAMCVEAGVCKQVSEKKVGDELVCEFCTHVLEHIKEEMTANTTVEEFRTALLNFCKVTGSFSAKCTSIVNDYYDMIFDYLRKLDTKELCTLITLCPKNQTVITPLVEIIPPFEMLKRLPLVRLEPAQLVTKDSEFQPLVKIVPAIVKNKNEMRESNDIFPTRIVNALPLDRYSHPLINFERDTECAFCRAITFYLQQDLKGDNSKAGIRKAMSHVCENWVKDFPEQCENFLNKYSQKVEFAIAEDMEYENICRKIKACPLEDTSSELNVRVIPPKAGPFCELCKETMTEIENKLKDPATKKLINDRLDQLCNVLPEALRDECTSFVNQNIDALFNILEQELTPDNICPAMKFCSGTSRIPPPQILNDIECDLCKEVVSSFRQNIQDPKFKATILKFLDEGCAELPGDLAKECTTIINENIDTVIGVIIQAMDPDTVCAILKVCPASVKKVKPLARNDLECDLCKEVVGKVEDMVKDKKTEDEIKKALDKVCSLLPASLSAKCENFVNTYVDTLILLITTEADPTVVCGLLNVCPKKKESTEKLVAKAQDIECQSCQYVLHFLQESLVSADTQEQVKDVLKKMCSVLPDTYSKNCEAFVDEYGSAFLMLIAQEIDPNSLCWELQMCHNQTRLFKVFSKDQVFPQKTSQCDLCTTIVNYMDQLLEEDAIDQEITALVEKVCVIVPASLKGQCTTVIETYGPYLLQMIGQVADSKQVCQDIDLCARPAFHAHLLGGHKCTFGPSYWCQSTAHAAACKADVYCNQRVWGQ